MSKTEVFPQVEAEQVKEAAQQDRYIAYAQCIHMLEAEAREKVKAEERETVQAKKTATEIGGRA